MTAAIDTHRAIKRLKDAGLSEAEAEAVTELLVETRSADLSELFTKRDGADLARDLRQEMELLKRDLTIRLGSMVVLAVGAVAALVKLL